MSQKIIKLKVIKKSRPKLKQGDIFYYSINDKYYLGIVILTELNNIVIGDNVVITILLVNYSVENINDVSIDLLIEKVESLDIIAPPLVINKKSWWLGYFNNLSNMSYNNSFILNNLRLECWDYICNSKGEKANDIPEIKLFGSSGIYGFEGVEYLIQLGLGLAYDENEEPYSYYIDDDFKKYIKNRKLPYWYYNSLPKK
ncbi:hypothetical protein RO21_05335 [[Actinobacillus] muris]|uniref:Uncharacterized protein n=1 Tax=Muribacter muris TaxID=67855 RepID=A0A0J5P750_9PAST|nr:hypothetical protein [Muribacter muris]KMK51605.1 hypothetical protein RO21_05335 [[Actinobacillus] muris] [Muribacter muris]